MRDFATSVVRFCKDESGPTSVEYLFMLSLVIFAAMIGITAVGNQTKVLFERSKNKIL
ncbi:MAG: Flp family type IVb pilin [Planctomycetota bacterium]|nr:Flp family type IVb pilin [Planctomycetota bacterium]MDA1247952.1 Flp family type IVb pilin [Planctomycetota bacterium]